MATDLSVCGQVGGNTGGIKCAVSPAKWLNWAIWLGKLTPNQLAVAATIKSTLVAHSKLAKSSTSKLFLMPTIIDRARNKEANTEQAFSGGLKVVTREGTPGWRFAFETSQQQMVELRKFNNFVLPIIFQDANKRTWGTKDADGNFIARQASIFFEGLDGADDATKGGIGYVTIGFIDAVESYDEQYFIQTPFSWQSTFKGLVDVQLYEKAAGTPIAAVAATRTVTITAIGTNADTIDIKDADGDSISGGPVAKTGSETTETLLAAKIVTAINAATGDTGYSAANTAAVITITAPAELGRSVNTVNTAPTIVGGITSTNTAFSGGVTTGVKLKVSMTQDTKEAGVASDLYSVFKDSALGTNEALWLPIKINTVTPSIFEVNPNNTDNYFEVSVDFGNYTLSPSLTQMFALNLAAPETLDAANVVGIEGLSFTHTKA